MTPQMRDVLVTAYLDYLNNYISVDCYAESNGLTREEGASLIALARTVSWHDHPEA
jgi:hypothetical protein